MMLRAIFFDFNGVILDDEEHHCESLRRVLAEEGVTISREAYYRDCLGFNDVECFQWAFADPEGIRRAGGMEVLVGRKSAYYQELLKQNTRFFPGVVEFIRAAAQKYPLGLASMALRSEIDWTLREAGIERLFSAIVSGEDVTRTKPDPEPYLEALERLNRAVAPGGRGAEVRPAECLVIEDSSQGIRSAKLAGMRVLGLTHSATAEEIREADWVFASLEGVALGIVEALFEAAPAGRGRA
ncbi:MAG: HAD family phosphatase [bacterium]